jgi:hypothetical protein
MYLFSGHPKTVSFIHHGWRSPVGCSSETPILEWHDNGLSIIIRGVYIVISQYLSKVQFLMFNDKSKGLS